VKEGLIPEEQQHWAAAGIRSTGQTAGSSSIMSFERQAKLEGDAGPSLKKELRLERRLAHEQNLRYV